MFMMGIMSVLLASCSLLAAYTKVTVKVIDEDNIPVNLADVEIGFRDIYAKAPGKGWGTGRVDCHSAKGKTNADGMFSASDNTSPNVVVTITKPDYYKSTEGVFNKDEIAKEEPLVIILKKKIKPVPMYAKRVNSAWGISKIPILNQDVGYDLEIGDWVAPHGKGKINDFIFNFKSEVNAWNDYECSYALTFSNTSDGIQEYNPGKAIQSEYRWPREAPLNDYKNILNKFSSNVPQTPVKTNFKKNDEINYIFRVRSRTDDKGNITEARYGKIDGEIEIYWSKTISFTYYFNPNGSTRLEFDTEKNLFIPAGAQKWKEQYRNFTGFAP